MKCTVCGKETGANWKKLCLSCFKKDMGKISNEQIDRNYLEASRAGNIQNDLDFSEDNNY